MGNYWMLEVREPKGASRAVIGKQPDLKNSTLAGSLDWLAGEPLGLELAAPLVFQICGQGNYVTDFFPPVIPLMSTRMLDALATAGADNIESFDAILLDQHGTPLPDSFRAINILARIACADLEASECDFDDPDDPAIIDFDSLVIDENKTMGQKLFRLHEAPNGIVVHDSIRQALEPLRLRGIVFVAPEDWIG